jgi:hypothetical protein
MPSTSRSWPRAAERHGKMADGACDPEATESPRLSIMGGPPRHRGARLRHLQRGAGVADTGYFAPSHIEEAQPSWRPGRRLRRNLVHRCYKPDVESWIAFLKRFQPPVVESLAPTSCIPQCDIGS